MSDRHSTERTSSTTAPSMTVPFAMVPCWLVREGLAAQLGPAAVSVYVAMITHAYGEQRLCYCSIRRLAQETGLSTRTVGRAINKLCEMGLIHLQDKARPGYRGRAYLLPTEPSILPKDDSTTTSDIGPVQRGDKRNTNMRHQDDEQVTREQRGAASGAYKLEANQESEQEAK